MKSYPQHYADARKHYCETERISRDAPQYRTIQDIGVKVFNAEEIATWSPIRPPSFYMDAVTTLAAYAREHFVKDTACFMPKNDAAFDFSRKLTIKTALNAPGANALCEALLPQIERIYFQSYLHADHVYFYRNLVTDSAPESSWKWHYDNHPVEMHKLMIYLTDVDEDTAPFEYLASPEGHPVPIAPSRTGHQHWTNPKWKGSRVPDDKLKQYLSQGYKPTKVVGPRGTLVLFDDNCIHRATAGTKSHRDVMVVQFRPAARQLRPYLDPKWTGSFEANDISMDPDAIAPLDKGNS